MSKTYRVISILFAIWLTTLSGHAQQKASDAELASQYESGRINGFQVTILTRQANGTLTAVEPEHDFYDNDQLKIAIKGNFPGFVYLVSFGSSGKNAVVFPGKDENNRLEPDRIYYLPENYDLGFVKDQKAGSETFQVLFSRERLTYLDSAIENTGGELSQEQSEEIKAFGKNSRTIQSNVRFEGQDLSRDPVFKQKKTSTIVIVSQRKPADEKAKTDDGATFKVRLKNRGSKR